MGELWPNWIWLWWSFDFLPQKIAVQVDWIVSDLRGERPAATSSERRIRDREDDDLRASLAQIREFADRGMQ